MKMLLLTDHTLNVGPVLMLCSQTSASGIIFKLHDNVNIKILTHAALRSFEIATKLIQKKGH